MPFLVNLAWIIYILQQKRHIHALKFILMHEFIYLLLFQNQIYKKKIKNKYDNAL